MKKCIVCKKEFESINKNNITCSYKCVWKLNDKIFKKLKNNAKL